MYFFSPVDLGFKAWGKTQILTIMKVVTNILLVAAMIIYLFLPLFEVEFDGGLTGFSYTANTLSDSADLAKQLFALLPFISCFGAIAFNCLKHRFWGFIVAVFIVCGILFYYFAKQFVLIQAPEVYHYVGIGSGFVIGYVLMICALASAILSLLPFAFNLLHEKPKSHGRA